MAITVALAVGMSRVARRGVIVRKLVAVEALGSCTIRKVIFLLISTGAAEIVLFLLVQGWAVEETRNRILLLMVLFENVQAFNSRSETLSVFRHNPPRDRLLLFGTIIAQLVRIAATCTPGLRDVLAIAPVSLDQWRALLGLALILLASMELRKGIRRALLDPQGKRN